MHLNSLFSDLNNLEVDTVTCDAYSDCFGFTEQEVMDAFKTEILACFTMDGRLTEESQRLCLRIRWNLCIVFRETLVYNKSVIKIT